MQKGKKLSKFTSGKKMSKGSRAKKDAAVFCNPEMEKQANAEPKRISLSRSDDEPCVVVESPLPLIYYIFHLETMKDIGWIAKCSIIARKKSDLAMKDEVEEGGVRVEHLKEILFIFSFVLPFRFVNCKFVIIIAIGHRIGGPFAHQSIKLCR
nr:hypothetical protein Iba_chr05aCG4320 [Ipomoea batatas]GMD01266.1 hypothetical protein Iba_chr05fCG5800 [Ipomoea batatas]